METTATKTMRKLAHRVEIISPSETLLMAQKSWELQERGVKVINLSIGEPDFYTPNYIKEAAKEAIDNNFSFYSPVAGYKDLKQAICDKLKRDNDLDYKPSQIVVSNGAKHSIANVLMSLVDEGDEVIMQIPYWVSYKELVKVVGGRNVYVHSNFYSNFKITPDQLMRAITPKTKLFIFNSPSNPSGVVYSYDEMKAFAKLLAKHEHIYILSDEIYEYINFVGKHVSLAQFPEIADRVITINGVSKGFAMPGWRIGYMAAPEWIAKACEKLQGQFTSGPSSISQKAAQAALTHGTEFTQEMCVTFKQRRDAVVEHLNTIEGIKFRVPEGAFYILIDISSYFGKSAQGFLVDNANDLTMYLLDKAHVACVSGAAFGSPDCIRISYANTMELLIEGMMRIKEALGNLS